MIIEFRNAKFKKAKCVCNKATCQKIREDFAALNDVRGHMIGFSTSKASTRKSRLEIRLDFWRKRACKKLGITLKSVNSGDNRNRKMNTDELQSQNISVNEDHELNEFNEVLNGQEGIALDTASNESSGDNEGETSSNQDNDVNGFSAVSNRQEDTTLDTVLNESIGDNEGEAASNQDNELNEFNEVLNGQEGSALDAASDESSGDYESEETSNHPDHTESVDDNTDLHEVSNGQGYDELDMVQNDSSVPEPKQKKRFIALWHYDPKVLDCANGIMSYKSGKYDLSKFVTTDKMKQLKLFDPNEKLHYDKQDLVEGSNEICVLPSYPMKCAKYDIQSCREQSELARLVDSIKAATKPAERKRKSSRGSNTITKRQKRYSRAEINSIIEENEKLREALVKATSKLDDMARKTHDTSPASQSEVNSVKRGESLEELYASKASGLNRISILSNHFHDTQKGLSKMLFGFDSIQEMKIMIEALTGVKFEAPTSLQVLPGVGLSKFEQIALSLVWMNLAVPHGVLGVMFGGINRKTVSKYINRWVPVLGERGDMISNLLPFLSSEVLQTLEPAAYKELGLPTLPYSLYFQ